MNIVFFAHPDFLNHQSMPRFTKMLYEGMLKRGHKVEVWSPVPKAFKIPGNTFVKKWLGYIDQYILFPEEVKTKLKKIQDKTLFVFTDNALGPWVPMVKDLPHVIHCHDFMAQLSAINEIPENKVNWTGQQYQSLIRRGFSKGENFISVSEKTRSDLHKFLNEIPLKSEVVYNGMNQKFEVRCPGEVRKKLTQETGIDLTKGYLLHVGGNQWYKNRKGIIEIYNTWREKFSGDIPLLLIGEQPNDELKELYENSPYKTDIYFFSGVEDRFVRDAYCGASLFLFPSLAEGFGWPIAEAMASGCPVITTNEAPMTEVGGEAAFYVDKKPLNDQNGLWAERTSQKIHDILNLPESIIQKVIDNGVINAQRFDQDGALDKIEMHYQSILKEA